MVGSDGTDKLTKFGVVSGKLTILLSINLRRCRLIMTIIKDKACSLWRSGPIPLVSLSVHLEVL